MGRERYYLRESRKTFGERAHLNETPNDIGKRRQSGSSPVSANNQVKGKTGKPGPCWRWSVGLQNVWKGAGGTGPGRYLRPEREATEGLWLGERHKLGAVICQPFDLKSGRGVHPSGHNRQPDKYTSTFLTFPRRSTFLLFPTSPCSLFLLQQATLPHLRHFHECCFLCQKNVPLSSYLTSRIRINFIASGRSFCSSTKQNSRYVSP